MVLFGAENETVSHVVISNRLSPGGSNDLTFQVSLLKHYEGEGLKGPVDCAILFEQPGSFIPRDEVHQIPVTGDRSIIFFMTTGERIELSLAKNDSRIFNSSLLLFSTICPSPERL